MTDPGKPDDPGQPPARKPLTPADAGRAAVVLEEHGRLKQQRERLKGVGDVDPGAFEVWVTAAHLGSMAVNDPVMRERLLTWLAEETERQARRVKASLDELGVDVEE